MSKHIVTLLLFKHNCWYGNVKMIRRRATRSVRVIRGMRSVLAGELIFAGSLLAAAPQPAAAPCGLLRSATLQQSAHEALDKKEYAAAARAFQGVYEACPTLHAALLDASRSSAQARDYPEAIRAARQFVDLEKGSVEGKLALANAYFMAQRLPDALEYAESVLKTEADQPAALKLKGNIEYLLGKTDDAVNVFIFLLDHYPQDADGAYMLGRIYYQEGRIDYAMGQFQRVLKIDPKSYKAYDNLGLCYQASGDAGLAIRNFLTAIKLVEKDHPDYDWAYANLASLLIDEGDAEKAYDAAAKAANRNPNSARNLYLGGKALWKLGKTDLCLNWLQRAAALDPKYPEPFYLLARVYSQLGQEDHAKAALDKFRALKAGAPRQRK
jgi:tetratricopeptide (TPR) repeat protein